MDGQTDRRTDGFAINNIALCMHCTLTRDNRICIFCSTPFLIIIFGESGDAGIYIVNKNEEMHKQSTGVNCMCEEECFQFLPK